MSNELQEIIKQSTFTVEEGRFIYVKVSEITEISKHFMVTIDKDEITIVTKEQNFVELKTLERNKDNWSLIALNVSIPFYCVGFLAAVSGELAKAGMDIMVVSTFSKDYV